MSKPKKGTPHPQLPPVDKPVAAVNPEAIESPLQATPNLDEVVGEVLRRRRARESLVEYCRSVELPGVPANDDLDAELFKPIETNMALHHRVILAAIQHTLEKANGRLMIFAPPGSAKSTYASVATVAWASAKYPNYRILIASYNSKLAWKQSRRARALCRDPKHVSIWPDRPELRKDQKAVDEWALSNGSEVVAGGLMSGITGNRADCFIGSTEVETPQGCVSISTITPDTEVLTYDHATRTPTWRKVLATRRTRRAGLVRVRTAQGRSFTCTADHRIFANGEYKAAGLLEPGDQLLAALCELSDPRNAQKLRVGEVRPDRAHGSVLLEVVSNQVVQSAAPSPGQSLRTVRNDVLPNAHDEPLLQSDVLRESSAHGRTEMPTVSNPVPTEITPASVLQPELCELTTCEKDDRHNEQQLEARPRRSIPRAVLQDSTTDRGARSGVCGLSENGKPGLSPHRRDANPQHSGEFGDAMQNASPKSARQDRVALVERLRGREDWVYDVQVEGTKCFFANGILAHNCVIIDDPVAGREEADSQGNRDKIEEEYRDSVISRLKPNGSAVVILTRWHEDDLAGRILPLDYAGQSGPIQCRDGMEWYVLNIPAEAEHEDDPLGRKLGEYLWPEWFPAEHWELRKRDPRGQRTWASLYQQRPTAGDGIEFKREWFQWYDPDIQPGEPGGRPLNLSLYGASDFATKEDRSADYTEHGVGGLSPVGDLYFVDWYYEQVTSDKYINAWIKMVRRWKPRKWWDEGNVIGQAIAPARIRAMREANPPIYVKTEQLTSIKNKTIKLASFQQYAANGRVYFPLKRPWAQRVVDQLCAFPAGRYDDAADVCGLFGRGLDEMTNAIDPTPEVKPQLKPFTEEWLFWEENDKPKIRYT